MESPAPLTNHTMTGPAVAIVGGGISGLAAAYECTTLGIPFVLFERSNRCGGVVLTEHVEGYTIDAGPDALLTQKPAASQLCHELGLGTRLHAPVARSTFVVRRGRLRRLPDASVLGMPAQWIPFATTGAFSWAGKLRMATEPLRGRGTGDDESIASFVRRRFGQHAVDYLADPLLAGIHGGDAARLSMQALFPRLLELEARHGSVIAGLRQASRISQPSAPAPSPFVAPSGGMSELTDALVQRLPAAAVRTGTAIEAIEKGRGGYVLRLGDGTVVAVPRLFLATPPAVTARLVHAIDPALAALSGRIRAASVVTVALGYHRMDVRHPLAGTGFLAPRRERMGVRAVSWVSSKWGGRAPADRVLLRAYIGGAHDPDAVDRTDGLLVDLAHRDAARLLHISGDPELARVYRWRDATPQLEVGHLDLMDSIERRLAANPDLAISAAGFRGCGIADCVADARKQANRIALAVARADQRAATTFGRASAIIDRTRAIAG